MLVHAGKCKQCKAQQKKLTRFSHLLQHFARKWGGLILQCSWAHTKHTTEGTVVSRGIAENAVIGCKLCISNMTQLAASLLSCNQYKRTIGGTDLAQTSMLFSVISKHHSAHVDNTVTICNAGENIYLRAKANRVSHVYFRAFAWSGFTARAASKSSRARR